MFELDVALVPDAVPAHSAAVLVVVDEIRASTTLTTLLDLGVPTVYIEGGLDAARRLGRATGSILVGERHALRPRGFDFDNSPTMLARADLHGRSVVLSTTNGTAILRRVRRSPHVLIGCLRNARACAEAAIDLARAHDTGIRIVCAGRERRFVLEDAVAAGVIATRIAEGAARLGVGVRPTDGATAARRLSTGHASMDDALEASDGGRTLHQIGQAADIAFCAAVDVTATVPVLRDGPTLRIERLERAASD
jgi:2-phosphosulfolactate phosphatase